MDVAGERAIVEKYASRIRAYGLRHMRNNASADDLVQQVLVTVLLALREGRVDDRERLDAYVLGTARNMAMDMKRGVSRQTRVADQASALLPKEYEVSLGYVDRGRLEHCLGELEPRDRTVVVATFVEDQDSDEIGQSLGISTGNVRVIRHRALAKLQTCVDDGAVS
jgi:RNA polymerase sigma-70 factor, ECF subfamily